MGRPSRTIPPARAAALDCLRTTLFKNCGLQAALDQALRKASPGSMQPRDAALATELAYGYLRLKGRVEHVLAAFLDNPEKLPDKILLPLGVGAYEILFLDKVPDYASVNWTVEHVKSVSGKRMAGLCNAVLRKVAGLGESAHDPEFYRKGASHVEFLARFYSCPAWMVELWLKFYGQEITEQYLRAQTRPPAMGLYLSPKGDPSPFEDVSGFMFREGLALAFEPGSGPKPLPEGAVSQSFAAHQALMALDPASWPGPVWDACCGRGNKTRSLLDACNVPVFASDLHRGRLRALHRDLPQVPVFRASADKPSPLRKRPGTVFLDLPCSGLGVLSRRPDIKWKRTPQDVSRLEKTQARILEASCAALDSGGMLAVLTCTLNPGENREQLRGLMGRGQGLKQVREWTTPPGSPLNEFFWGALLKKG